MRRMRMTTTAIAGAALLGTVSGTAASAQGIALFGDARLGLGYNIDNDGGILTETDDAGEVSTPDDLRAVSRVRFGVNMTGETDSGITFGATIRADNAEGGEGDVDGQFEGDVFVSGSFGTLTMGDTNAADEQWVGDVPGDFSLTGLGELDETRFISNGGSFGADDGVNFAANPFARPTIRYDFDIMGFGMSVSSNRDLTDIGVGAGYAADFGGGSWSVGAGYYKFDQFVQVGETANFILEDSDGDGSPDAIVEGDPIESIVPEGEQWSVGLMAEYASFAFGATYASLSSETSENGRYEFGQPPPRRLLHLRCLVGRCDVRQDHRRLRRARGDRRRGQLRALGAIRPRRRRDRERRRPAHLQPRQCRRLGGRYRLDRRLRHRDELLSRRPLAASAASLGGPGGAKVPPMPIDDIRTRIDAALSRAGRAPGSATLVAVSKVQPEDRVRAVLDAGQRVFGENRVQEAETRWLPLRERLPRHRAPPRRPAADQQARPRPRPLRCHPQPRPRLARREARHRRPGPRRLPDALRPGQYRA